MASLRAIREIHVQHTSEGAEKVRRELEQQTAANDKLAKSSESVATATETSARRQQSAAGGYDRLRSSLDQTYRAQQQFERGQRTLDRAFQQGVVDAQEYGRVQEMLRSRLHASTVANDNSARAAARNAAELSNLRASLDPAYASARRMAEEVDNLARLERAGIEVHGGYDAALGRIIEKYDETAQAARRAAEANAAYIQSARDAQAAENARQIAEANQGAFNRVLGVRPTSSGAARASAAVFEEDAASLARLRAELNPVAQAQARVTEEVERYQRWARQGQITTDELATATARSRQRFDEFRQSLDRSGESGEGVLSRLGALASRIGPLMATFGVGLGSVSGLALLGDSSRRMEEAERAARRLQAVLDATGAAAGLSGREIASFADRIEEQTGRAAEEVMAVAAQLATFTSIGRDEFQRTILVANDMADIFGGSLQSSLDAVARALDDPIKGFQNLRQRGFALEEQELELVKAFQAVGDTAAAQNVVLQNLERQVGGASARAFDELTKAQADSTKAAEDAIDAFNRVSGAHEARIGATRAFGSAMSFAKDNMETIVPVGGTLTALLGARLATSLLTSTAAANAFGGAMTMITTRAGLASAAMALLGGPIGIGVTTVTAVAAGLLLWARNGDEANRSLSEHENIVTAIRDRYREADEARRQLTRGELEQDYRDLEVRASGDRAAMEAAQARLRATVEGQMFTLGRSSASGAGPLAELSETFLRGEMSAKSFGTELQTLRRTNEDVARILDEIALRDASFELLALAAGVLEEQLAGTNSQLDESRRRLGDLKNSAVAAANAFASFQANLAAIREFDPVFTRQAKMQADMATATEQHAQAVAQLNEHLANGGSQADFDRGLTDANEALRASTAAISGLTDARARLDAYESNARIGGMNPREQAIARERENYQTLRQSIIDAGTASGDLLGVGAELARAQAAHEQVVGQLSARFDEQDAAARRSAAGQRTARDAGEEAVAALERQIDALGRSDGYSAAAEFRARELSRALQEAAASDNGVVSEKTRRDIEDAALRIGVLTDRLAALREEEQRRERVSETLADLEFEGSIFGLSDVEQQVARQLHQLKLSHADLDGQRIAGQIRYNASLDETRERLEKQRQLLQNVASTFLDIFTDASSDSFFDRILKGLADISRQFAELGKQRLMEGLFGSTALYTSGFPAPGQRTTSPVGIPSSGVGLYAPTAQASTATQAIAEQLSTNVTKTVSDNLLRNMLGAGKDPSHIRGLNAEFASSLTQMFEAAPEAVRASVTINSGFRSVARQAELFEAALTKYGSEAAARKWVAPPGRSQHNFGRAVDLGYANDDARKWVHANAERFGLRFPMSHENWHVEPAGARGGNALRSAVAGGVVDAQRALASGQAGMPSSVPIPSARPGQAAASGGLGGMFGGGLDGLRNLMQSPLGMGGMNAFSAFGAGMSSGSPISGGLSGGLGAIGMGLGPVGIAAGVVGGLLGGLFGRSRQRRAERRQREEQERQQRLQAQQQLEQQLPAILELQDTLLDRASGTLMKEKARIESQIKQYQTLAKTAKNQTEIDRLNSMADSLNDYMERQYDQLRLTASSVIQSLAAGRGLEPEFAKAVSAVREQSLSIRNYLADLTAAAGAGSAEVQAATAAGREQLLRTLSGAEEVTEIWTKLDSLTGTASQLSTELQKLGMSAEDAGRAISDHLGRGIQKMRDEFVRGIADETAESMDLGYLPQLQALRKRRDTMRADATSLGADPALIDRWFAVQAQAVVNNAGLMGDELAKLKEVFPDVTAVISDSLAKLEQERSTAESELRRQYDATSGAIQRSIDQLSNFRSSIRSLLDEFKLDRNLTTLSPAERLAEAERQFRDVYDKAIAGDQQAQSDLAGVARSYLEEGRSFWASSEQYAAIQQNVVAMMRQADAQATVRVTTAERQLEMLREQVSKLIDLDDTVQRNAEALQASLVDLRGVTILTAGELASRLTASGTAESQLLAGHIAGLNATTLVGYDRLTGQFVSLGGKLQSGNKELVGSIVAGDHQIAAGQLGLKTTIDGQTNALSTQLLVQSGSMTAIHSAITALTDLTARVDVAQAARDAAQGQALQAYVKALNPNAAIPSYQAPGPVTGNPAPAPAPGPAAPALVNQTMWNGSSYSNYVGTWTTLTDRGLISFIGSDRLFVPTGMDQTSAMILSNTNRAGPSKGPVFNWDTKRLGGEIGRGYGGLGYQAGGVVANGIWDVDSVFARHRDGGAVMLAGGEFVMTARGVNAQTRPMLDFINREHRLPQIALSQAPATGSAAIDVRSIVLAIERLERRIEDVAGRQTRAIVSSDDATRDAIRSTSEATRRRDASANRIAEKRAELRSARVA